MAEIKAYTVRFNGGPLGSGTGVVGQIMLFGTDNHLVGRIDFYPPGLKLPQDKNSDHIVMAMETNMMQSVIDVLRHEKPMYIYWQVSLNNAFLGTSQEEVGEEEKVAPDWEDDEYDDD